MTSSSDGFVHLHVHTEYSMLDGAARLSDMFGRTTELGMGAVAMTDHGNVFGAHDFYAKARAAGVKPIIGMEAYLAPNTSRFDRKRVRWNNGGDDDVSGGGAYTHMTLLAETTTGMHNLFRLASRSSTEGFFYKPRADRELLAQYAPGLIGTTGCPSGEVQTWLRIGKYDKARESAGEFQDIFGKENFFLELMDHGLSIEARVRDGLLALARDLKLPMVATNDSHYTAPEDAKSHEALLCIQTGSTLHDANRFKLEGGGYYLKSPQEMRALWQDTYSLREACDNTLLIAERCNVEFNEDANLMPVFDVPAGEDASSWFVKEVERGLVTRYPLGIPDEVRRRADYEVQMILSMGFPGYFLVTADLIGWAKGQGIRVGPGRGSATGSLVAYAMGITELDPLEHSLLFERFLNPERVSMPDIDIDFDERRRGEVMRYVTDKYGEDRVAQVVTYGTIKTKQALKDASRVLGYPFAMGERVTKALPPPVMAKDIPIKDLFEPTHARYQEGAEFRGLVQSDPEVAKVVETARGLEGLKRQWGVHACAVIMSSEPLMDHIPVMKREQDGAIITQFDYPTCETLGLLKMDFLGLRNLTVIDDTIRHVSANRGEDVGLEGASLDDPATYELLGRGDTLGVFQLDGGPMRSLLRLMAPTSFEDISAVLALYRPGPMAANAHIDYADRKNHRKPVTTIHPELTEPLAEILDETFGLVVYQEQVQAIARKVAGYSLGQADLLRRAMGKKKRAELDAQLENFTAGMRAGGFTQSAIDALWNTLLPFCDYGFNKSHTAGYGMVSFWTAYLKAHYPAEYMAALLTSVKDDKDKLAVYLNECRRMKIQVLPPDVNESSANFTPVENDIRFGLTAIRNVGTKVVDQIIETREEKGRYTDFADFMSKVPPQVCNKRLIESLIKAGAFDSLKHGRRVLVAVHDSYVDQYVDIKRNEAIGQDSLFAAMDGPADAAWGVHIELPDIEEWDKQTLLAHEREMLGLYVSDHPLLGIEHVLANAADCTIGAILADEEKADGAIVTVAGLITSVTNKLTKTGNSWAMLNVEDLEGAIDVLVFPSAYAPVSTMLVADTVVKIKAKVARGKEQPELHALEISRPDLTESGTGPVEISLPMTRCTPPVVNALKDVLRTHPGVTEVRLRLLARSATTLMRLDDGLRVSPSPSLFADLKQLLGPGCLK